MPWMIWKCWISSIARSVPTPFSLAMTRRSLIAGLLLLASVHGLFAQPQKNAAKATRPAPAQRPAAAAKAAGKEAPRLANPGAIVQQLMQMTPEQRERALEKLPPQRQAQIRQRLDQFDRLPKQQQERRLEQLRQLSSLPPETQTQVRQQMRAFNQLPVVRRRAVAIELQRLRRMPESERQARIGSEDFQNTFSPSEQQILSDISENMPFPR
ncbi:MAG: hypothetical protein C5B51_16720 [Terriglobia bacterium]|nr:MAG: hypothetical protein C5B51_16720 [Terriglobia bacterium]